VFFVVVLFHEPIIVIFQELFKRLVPHHCLGAVWSRRADKKCAVLPVSVYSTVDQFNAVSYRVMATVLKYPYAPKIERAFVIEKWIDVAQVCYYHYSSELSNLSFFRYNIHNHVGKLVAT